MACFDSSLSTLQALGSGVRGQGSLRSTLTLGYSHLVSLSSSPSQIFEWWYFRKYGTSFIEQVSVSHLRPLLGGVDSSSPSNSNTSNGEADSSRQSVSGKS